MEPDPQPEPATPLDALAQELQGLRMSAGAPSYAEIARRVGEQRTVDDPGDARGRPPKTTVYDVFRLGRRRVDMELALEIVRVLGCDDAETATWRARYQLALGAEVPVVPRSRTAEPMPEVPEAVTAPVRAGAWKVVAVLAVCLLVNVVAGRIAAFTHLPLYFDMIGTAIAAVVLGPWWGALVGVLTNLTEVVPLDGNVLAPHWDGLPFAVVNVAGALVWGYGVRRLGYGRTVARFFLLNVAVAVVCSIVAVPVIVALGQDADDVSIQQITASFDVAYHDLVASLFSSNILTSLADKLISGFFALTAVDLLPAAWRLPHYLTAGDGGMAWRPRSFGLVRG